MEPCKSCDFENTEGSLFCGGCGVDIGIKCDRCGEINKNQAFCTNCGQVVSSDLEARYESQNLSDTENIQYEPHQPVNSEDQLLPKPGQLVDLITVSVSAYKQNFKSFLILALVNGVPALLIGIIVRALLEAETISLQDLQQYGETQLSGNFFSELKTIPTWKIFTILIFILISPIAKLISATAIIVGAAQFTNSQKVSPIVCLNYSMSRLGRLIILSLFLIGLLIIPVALSLIWIGIPILIFLLVRWLFAWSSMVLDNTGITRSIQTSWELVEKRWWSTFGVFLSILILTMLPIILLTLLSSNLKSDLTLLILDVFVGALISPFQFIVTGIYFLSLKKFPKS
jgi:hypothetical protein